MLFIFYPENGCGMILRNAANHLLHCRVSYLRRPQYEFHLHEKPQIYKTNSLPQTSLTPQKTIFQTVLDFKFCWQLIRIAMLTFMLWIQKIWTCTLYFNIYHVVLKTVFIRKTSLLKMKLNTRKCPVSEGYIQSDLRNAVCNDYSSFWGTIPASTSKDWVWILGQNRQCDQPGIKLVSQSRLQSSGIKTLVPIYQILLNRTSDDQNLDATARTSNITQVIPTPRPTSILGVISPLLVPRLYSTESQGDRQTIN
jgi:hypothetical protein